MQNNDEKILKALEALQADVANIKKNMATKQDIADVRQDAARTNTALDAVGAGVRELREIVATKVDVMDVGVKVDKLRKRIEGLEETEGITHKN